MILYRISKIGYSKNYYANPDVITLGIDTDYILFSQRYELQVYEFQETYFLQMNVEKSTFYLCETLRNNATIHKVTTMLATSKNVLFPSHNHLLTTDIDDPSLAGAQVIIKV